VFSIAEQKQITGFPQITVSYLLCVQQVIGMIQQFLRDIPFKLHIAPAPLVCALHCDLAMGCHTISTRRLK
jgi:hypothetical protein